MPRFSQLPISFFRLFKRPPQIAYALGLGPLIGRFILLLTTTGRGSGLPRVTPLQYETDGENFYVGAVRGLKSDWVRNILASPQVELRVKNHHLQGTAEVIQNPERVVDFLQLRRKNHPRMMAVLFKTAGIPPNPTRSHLEEYANQIALVIITPDRFDAREHNKEDG